MSEKLSSLLPVIAILIFAAIVVFRMFQSKNDEASGDSNESESGSATKKRRFMTGDKYAASGLCVGAILGAVIGSSMERTALGVGIGLLVGVIIGILFDRKK